MSNELILNKIRLLLNLASSPNENEAATARDMADKLIAKYNITEEDLETIKDKPPPYNDGNKLYSTIGLDSWRNQLALGISTKYECFLVQEEAVPVEGISEFSYFVIGDSENIETVRLVFSTLEKKVEELILLNCAGRGPIYSHSYAEGVVEGIKSNLDFIYFEVSKAINKPGPDATLNVGNECITKHSEKEKPIKETININSQSLIKDIHAYFRGVADGNKIDSEEEIYLTRCNNIEQLKD
jgi:hypothetical protein